MIKQTLRDHGMISLSLPGHDAKLAKQPYFGTSGEICEGARQKRVHLIKQEVDCQQIFVDGFGDVTENGHPHSWFFNQNK